MKTESKDVYTAPRLEPVRVWRARHRGIAIEIKHRPTETPSSYLPNGHWCYYLYLREDQCADFSKIWLPDEVKKWSEHRSEYVTHDYMRGPVGEIEMHGGITYYRKHGHTEGHRCVEIGCDYQHLYDDQTEWRETDLLYDAVRAVNSAYELGILVEPKAEPIPSVGAEKLSNVVTKK